VTHSKMRSARWRLNRFRAEQHFNRALRDQKAGQISRETPFLLPARLVMLFILALPIPFFVLALLCLRAAWEHWLMFFPAAFLLTLTWVLLPRRPRLDPNAVPISDFPQLATCLSEIAGKVGISPPDQVVFDAELNASVLRVGKRSQLYIGLNLWDALNDDEKTALLAHELAHLANGDPERGVLFSYALQSLETWYMLLTPDEYVYEDGSRAYGGFVEQLTELTLWIVRLPIFWTWSLLHRLLSSEQQRAEYFADAVAVRIAGKDAVHGLLRKTVLIPLSLRARNQLYRASGERLSKALVEAITSPDTESAEKLMAEMKEEQSAVDATHPPTIYRMRFIEALAEDDAVRIRRSYRMIDQEFSAIRWKSWDQLSARLEYEQEMGVRYG